MGREGGRSDSGDRHVDAQIAESQEDTREPGNSGERGLKFKQILNRDNPFFDRIAETMDYPTFEHVPAKLRDADEDTLYAFYYAAALMREASEVFDLVEKSLKGQPIDKEKMGEELTDVGWYLAAVSNILGIPLTPAARNKCDKIKKRIDAGYYKGTNNGNA